jgi:hypothetical protein
MTTLNLDELLVINDSDPLTYSEGHPGAGTPQAMFSQDHWAGPELAMFHKNVRGLVLYRTFSVGGWEAGSYHRVEHEGPLVEGPQAWMNENAITLTAHKQEPREQILVTDGDTIILRGTEYTVSVDRFGYIELTRTEVPTS